MSYYVARLLLMVPIEPWQNSTPFFGAVAFCTTKIDNIKTTCPCQCHIQRLHYPAFAAFFLYHLQFVVVVIVFVFMFVVLKSVKVTQNSPYQGMAERNLENFSLKGRLPSNIDFHQRLSSIKFCFYRRVRGSFHQRSSAAF